MRLFLVSDFLSFPLSRVGCSGRRKAVLVCTRSPLHVPVLGLRGLEGLALALLGSGTCHALVVAPRVAGFRFAGGTSDGYVFHARLFRCCAAAGRHFLWLGRLNEQFDGYLVCWYGSKVRQAIQIWVS
jgi:hypothetical protein